MMSQKRDYYEVLGISKGASQSEIKRAFKRLAREHHPDVSANDKDEAEERFKEINEAYQVLSDDQKRQVYDSYGHAGFEQGFGQDSGYGGYGDFGGFGDIFDMFFGGGQRTSGRSRPTVEHGNDLRHDVQLTLEEASSGISHTFKMTRMETCETCDGSGAAPGSEPTTCPMCHGQGQVRQQQQTILGTSVRISTCPRCHGQGKTIGSPCVDCAGQGRVRRTVEKTVDIPAGVDSGMRIRVNGEGDAGPHSGPSGDLYIFTTVKKHDFFERRNRDLWCEIPISISMAALGAVIDARTIDGTEELEIDPGTQPGEVYVLRGKGMPEPGSSIRGDLNAVIRVETPTHLNDEQKTLLRQLAKSRGEEIRPPKGKSFFEKVKKAFT